MAGSQAGDIIDGARHGGLLAAMRGRIVRGRSGKLLGLAVDGVALAVSPGDRVRGVSQRLVPGHDRRR